MYDFKLAFYSVSNQCFNSNRTISDFFLAIYPVYSATIRKWKNSDILQYERCTSNNGAHNNVGVYKRIMQKRLSGWSIAAT